MRNMEMPELQHSQVFNAEVGSSVMREETGLLFLCEKVVPQERDLGDASPK
jgi:hypothetical protein